MKKWHKLSLLSLCTALLLGALFLWHLSILAHRTDVTFLNVGQGDAILISQGSSQILIDGGRSGKELLARLGRHVPFWDRRIEVVIATHPDADHIGGLPALLRTYHVDRILTTGAESDTEISRLFQKTVRDKTGGPPVTIFRGAEMVFPHGGTLSIVYPNGPLTSGDVRETNQGSIVARFVYGETSFLLTGDLAQEEQVLGESPKATVLKVAHHGSKYSTSDTFLRMISPTDAIISVGKNSYGHPDSSVLRRLESAGARIYRTDELGDIRYRCFENRCLLAR
jgi:competence protein ComEC